MILLGVSVGVSLLAAVLQLVAILVSFEYATNYFSVGALLPAIAAIAAVIGGIVGIVAACLMPKEGFTASPFPKFDFFTFPAAFLFLAFGVTLLFSNDATESARALRAPTIVACLLAAFYCTLSALPTIRKSHKSLTALVGFAAPIACALTNAYYYFDLSVEMNAPLKYCVQVPLLFAMLYFLGEIRYLIGEPKPRFFLALSACTLASAALCAFAFPAAFLQGAITRFDYVMGALLVLAICIGICAHTWSLLNLATRSNFPAVSTQDPSKEDDQAV